MKTLTEISLEALTAVTGGDGSFPVTFPNGIPLAGGGNGPSNFNCTNVGNGMMDCKAVGGDASGQTWSMPQSFPQQNGGVSMGSVGSDE